MQYLFFLWLLVKSLVGSAIYSYYLFDQGEENVAVGIALMGIVFSGVWYFCMRRFRWQWRDHGSSAWVFLRAFKIGAMIGLVLGIVTALCIFAVGVTDANKKELDFLTVVSVSCIVGSAVLVGFINGAIRGIAHEFSELLDKR